MTRASQCVPGRSAAALSGFTLWELMVVVALVVILILAAMENLLPLRGEAERATHLATAAALASAVGLEATRRVVTGGARALQGMDGENPVAWLNMLPANYWGDVGGNGFDAVPRGHWAFDAGAGILFYRARYPEYFTGSFQDPAGVRYRVTVSRDNGGRVRDVRLHNVDTVAWKTDGSEITRWLEKTR